ncbi:ABC transporter C-terminal domain-containing protein [Helicobacter winghamensis]
MPKNSPKEAQKKTKLSYHEKRLLEILPQEIEALETELKALENLLYNGNLSTQELQEKSKEFEEKKAICEAKILQYLDLEEMESCSGTKEKQWHIQS